MMPKTVAFKAGRIVSYAKELERLVDRAAAANMVKALVWLKAQMQRNVNVGGSRGNHSMPGEYPRKITGVLQGRIFWRKPRQAGKSVVGEIGTDLFYGVIHEVKNRSYIRRTLYENRKVVGRIMGGGRPV